MPLRYSSPFYPGAGAAGAERAAPTAAARGEDASINSSAERSAADAAPNAQAPGREGTARGGARGPVPPYALIGAAEPAITPATDARRPCSRRSRAHEFRRSAAMGRAMPRDRVLAGAPPVSRWRGGEARQGKYPGRGPGDTRLRHRLPAPRRSRSPPREPGFGRPRRVDWRAAPPPSACSRRGARREDLVARRFRLVAFRPGEGCPLRRHNAPIAAAAPGRAAAATRGAGRRPKPRPRGPAAPVPACLGADVPRRRALRAGAPPPAHGPGSRPRPLPGGRVTAAAPSAAPAALPVAPPLAALGSAGGGAHTPPEVP